MANINTDEVAARFTKARPTGFDSSMAPDSDAKRCFVEQGFSRKMQIFLLDYTLRIQSPLSHTMGTK